ncbi:MULTISPECIES: TPM domain-containing protein [Sphingobium]|uniref:TPM domain-containing protein n=1 Tax=Sphingobium TaxID=165695 RepID=UPI001838629C|nr:MULTISPECIES: hypothetical protein [Sphingobium]MCW2364421.1 putative membrane protein [Sphingobium sp. B10D3B]MCW2402182.1 putative membrane protein [Sphingobium sp. B10D7B]MCW2409161.1 putative membrane protein [Sphingobium xanthum]
MSEADHRIVTDAVAKAELKTDAEIVTIVARRSDAYHDVGLHWSLLFMLLVPLIAAAFPAAYERALIGLTGGWHHELPRHLLYLLMFGQMCLHFLIMRYLLAIPALRMLVTPGATKSRRVRRRALLLFRTSAEARTRRLTGMLLYLSLDEHRAEIVADEAIASRVSPEVWGEAMAAMIDEVRAGRIAQGMALAIEKAGLILAEHCPKSADNPNELPDRLIEL